MSITSPMALSPPGRGRMPRTLGGIPRRELATAALLSAGLTAVWRLVVPLEQPCCDATQYLRLAADPDAAVPTPYSYRVLLPRLVHLLGTDPEVTYHVLAVACLALAGPLVYLLARRLGAGHGMALLGMAGLLSSRGWVFYLSDPWLSDPAALPLVAGAFLALVGGRGWLLSAALLTLATTRELFAGMLLPAYAWLARWRVDRGAAVLAAVVVLPAAAAYQWVVATVPSTGMEGYGRISLTVVAEVLQRQLGAGRAPVSVAAAFAMSLGVWWVVAAAGWRDAGIRRLAWWLVPVFGQLLFGWDWARFALYAFPVVIPAAALALDRHPRRAALRWLVAAALVTPVVDVLAGNPTLNYPGPSLVVTLALMIATAVVLAAPARNRAGHTPTGLTAEPVGRQEAA